LYRAGRITGMSTETQELLEICEQLPAAKRAEVADFARFLLAREGDERWEQIIADPRPRPKLDEFVRQAMSEGSEPLDVDKLSSRALRRALGMDCGG
jgi:hypothetical protein